MPRSKVRKTAKKKLAAERASLEKRGLVRRVRTPKRYYDPAKNPYPRKPK